MVKENLTPAEIAWHIKDSKAEIAATEQEVARRTGLLKQRAERRLAEAKEDLASLEKMQSQGG